MASRRGVATRGGGFFAVGIYRPKRESNVGSLFRSATVFGVAMVFTVGARYHRQASDTPNTPAHLPLLHFTDMEDLVGHLPHSCPLVGVELDDTAWPLASYVHPVRAAYLLGAEDNGLPPQVLKRCHELVRIESAQPWSLKRRMRRDGAAARPAHQERKGITMSRYSGPQGRGAGKAARVLRRQQAYQRQVAYRDRTGKGCDPADMLPRTKPEVTSGE